MKEYLELISVLQEKCNQKYILYTDLRTNVENIKSSKKALKLITNRINFKKSKMLNETINVSENNCKIINEKIINLNIEIEKFELKKKSLEEANE